MFKNIVVFLIVSISLLLSVESNAQTIEKNKKNESIVVYPDGSWRHFDPNNPEDQQLMQDYLKKRGAGNNNVISTTPSSKSDPIFNEFEEEETNITNLLLDAQTTASKAEAAYFKATSNKDLLESEYKKLKKRKPRNKATEQKLKQQIEIATQQESIAKIDFLKASKQVTNYQKIALMNAENQKSALVKLEVKDEPKEEKIDSPSIAKQEKIEPKKAAKPKPQKKDIAKTQAKGKAKKNPKPKAAIPDTTPVFGKTASSFKQLRPEDDLMLNPPQLDCAVAFEGVDEFSGKKRKDIAPAHFFSYTNDNLRSLFKDKEMINCSGHLSSVSGGLNYLSLKITILDERAQQNYGFIDKGSLLSIKLVDGSNVQLINKKTSQGTHNRFEQNVVYTVQYLIGPNQEKALLKTEIDKVRVVWSTGFEEYEVYETDFLMNQLNCLRN